MKRLLLHFFIAFLFSPSFSQTVERGDPLPVYTYSFAQSIDWGIPKDHFHIQVISRDESIRRQFQYLSDSMTINEKPINVTFTGSPLVQEKVDIVFVDRRFNLAVRSILNQVTGDRVLVITDGFTDERFIMINFVEQDDQTLKFQINNANIINQGLNVLKEDLFLLGGSEVDVAKLYREAQDSLVTMESKISLLQRSSDSLLANVNLASEQIEKQDEIIASQTNEIEFQQAIVNRQKSSLIKYLATVQRESVLLEKELISQRDSVEKGSIVLKAQNDLIDTREDEIRFKEMEVRRMESVVISQKNRLYYLLILSITLVLFSVVIYRAYAARRRDARKLAKQKEELSKILGELREAQTQLVQSEKMASLGVLIAGIAHEINNAINFVYSGIHIIKSKLNDLDPLINKIGVLTGKEDDLKTKVQEIVELKEELDFQGSKKLMSDMVKNVQIGAERTIEIIKGLKTFSRLETEEKTRIDLHKDLDIALLLLESRHKNIVPIDKDYDDNIVEIDGYQGQLGQAFLNMIGNALDALEGVKDPKIITKTQRSKDKVEVSIKDNGIGIDEDVMEKIFDPFFTTKGIGIGTGLGLSITYGIVEKHDGSIGVNSKPGEGAEFVIELPS